MRSATKKSFTETAFHEDKEIIEAQQTVLMSRPERTMLSTSSDAGPNLSRGIVKQLAEAERQAPDCALAAALAS
jgi:hypothetical protein